MSTLKVKVNLNSIKKSEKYIKDTIDRVLKETEVLPEIGELIRNDVVFQARRKNQYTNSDKWKETRKAIAAAQDVDPTFAPNRGNYTLSGQLLNSFKAFVNKAKGIISLEFIGQHDTYRAAKKTQWTVRTHRRTVNGKSTTVSSHQRTQSGGTYEVGKEIDNSEIATYLRQTKGDFLIVRDQIQNRARVLLSRTIKRFYKSLGINAD